MARSKKTTEPGKVSRSGGQWDMTTKWYTRQKLPTSAASSGASNGPSSDAFRFMDLPKDIRLMVYECLPNMSNIPSPLNDSLPDTDDCFLRDWTFNTAILATCKQVREEAQALLKIRMAALHQDPLYLLVQTTSSGRDLKKALGPLYILSSAIWFFGIHLAKQDRENNNQRGIEEQLAMTDFRMECAWADETHYGLKYETVREDMLLFLSRIVHAFLERRPFEVELVYDLSLPDDTPASLRPLITIELVQCALGKHFDHRVKVLGTPEQKTELAERMVKYLVAFGQQNVEPRTLAHFERPIMASAYDEISDRLHLEPEVLRIPCRK
ncbi:hypothetical protein BU16DRAFT_562629 [Lophium mytilinum]|uniref:F-box domain-containing protein n=1 Tax=Lophium mytilinum TaxID=390894 RepID=A0A6A6QS72_9PEZI|nr:hypothetical protein BU16DRAFT_562629 [Lophium mytilinum]